jgi:DNA-binding transcriptional ArsR family regulator
VDELEIRMREVLLQLALTSNGRTSSYNSSGGSEHDYTPTLGAGDAPHLHFARLWNAASSDAQRAEIFDQAQATLRQVLHSSGDPGRTESKADRDTRIVEVGEALPAREVAYRFHCGIRDVWNARATAGRETEFGRKPRNGRELSPDARRGEVERLAGDGMSARQIAVALDLSYSTVRRDLGAKS